MPYKAATFWNNKLRSHPNIRHCYYRISDVQNIPAVPGIYSWHLWIDNVNGDKYSQVFKQKRVKVNIKSNLSENYEGDLPHVDMDSSIFDSSLDINLCNIASIAMCPPLYIGISKDLKDRLSQHVDEFNKIVKGTIPTPVPTLSSTQFDTIYESQHFAQRMGFVVSKLSNLNSTNLLIKTIEMPMGYSRLELFKVEKFLNRTYFPIYGRR